MDWNSDLTQDGIPVAVKDYKRYNNPYATADFPAEKITFQCKGHLLTLDFKTKTRLASDAQRSGTASVN